MRGAPPRVGAGRGLGFPPAVEDRAELVDGADLRIRLRATGPGYRAHVDPYRAHADRLRAAHVALHVVAHVHGMGGIDSRGIERRVEDIGARLGGPGIGGSGATWHSPTITAAQKPMNQSMSAARPAKRFASSSLP